MVIAIIAVLIGLLLPAVQKVREAAAKSECANNLKQIGLGLHNYESSYQRFPSGGQGTDYSTNPPSTTFALHSTFTLLLPFVEQENVYRQMDLRRAYNDPRAPGNQVAAKTTIKTFLCPSNPFDRNDPEGYGLVDFMPTVYTDIHPRTGIRDRASRTDGALVVRGPRATHVTDGLSSTIAIAEDVGKQYPGITGRYLDPITNRLRAPTRWAEPSTGNGVSGPPGNGLPGRSLTSPINNSATPHGGPPDCLWSQNNCGPNDEIFSFHSGGALVVFCDGHVSLLSDALTPQALRALVTPRGGEPIPPGVDY